MCACARARAYVRTCVRACVRVCVRVCVRASVSVSTCACVSACLRVCVSACQCVSVCVRACVRVCIFYNIYNNYLLYSFRYVNEFANCRYMSYDVGLLCRYSVYTEFLSESTPYVNFHLQVNTSSRDCYGNKLEKVTTVQYKCRHIILLIE